MILFHLFNVLNAGLGAAAAVAAVLLWSGSRRFSTTALSLTAVLLYAAVILELCASYGLFGTSRLPAGEVPLLRSVFFTILLAAMFVTLLFFIREKKSNVK
ncbi:MAG: hypothetical protein JXQ30_08495 [Spirochaetes bacterium]|nr:hypothetical protein [Spirochaetota bacterium]